MSRAQDPAQPSSRFTPTLQAGDDTPVGPMRRWLAHARGWPCGVPVRNDLQQRVRYELSRTSVGEDLLVRFRRAGLSRIGRGAVWGGLVGAAPGLAHLAVMLLGADATVISLAVITMLIVQWLAIHRLARVVLGPRTRAGLRREGVDCCVRCGHLMGTGGPDDACPECGFDHAAFPLGWTPDASAVRGGPR